ncbi:hypothetical protein [Desulfosporosinus nitroreducens]|uniref:Uncharacterized protein n=1 Tax=Desulfosporosinus nitroreducens TaxID=2018668 RepID=A0ABT8QMG1_9FIRM|nr:hypothetical protein [Desulfosporosinus nitroreducens]MDO0821283.1 hypothetical protein [Desulfosporosinus nitroreducens]
MTTIRACSIAGFLYREISGQSDNPTIIRLSGWPLISLKESIPDLYALTPDLYLANDLSLNFISIV